MIHVAVNNEPVCVILDEEGKIKGLPRNEEANRLFQHFLFSYDQLVGPVIIVGDYDDEGEFTDVPDLNLYR